MQIQKNVLDKVIEEYNRYRSPHVIAEVVNSDENGFKVKFSGKFCQTCGLDEYFQDLVHELGEEGVQAKLVNFKQKGEETFIAEYKIDRTSAG